MKTLLLYLIFLFLSLTSYGQTVPEKLGEKDFAIGKTVTIQSSILGEERDLNIYLPQSYFEDSTKQYPVIYLLDGSVDEDFIHVSGIVQFASFSWINLIEESIVVGIANVDRKRDFTYPTGNKRDQKKYPTSGKSEIFIQFIEKELQIFIDSNYRISDEKTLIGQSLGGLLATEILFKAPNMFNKYLIVSPSLWWDDEKLLNHDVPIAVKDKSVYIAVGKEGKIMEGTAEALYEKLRPYSKDGANLFFDFLEDKTHGDALHEAVYHAFEKMSK